MKSDWRAVHDRLLDDFDEIEDVFATTMAGTLLILYGGDPDVDAWPTESARRSSVGHSAPAGGAFTASWSALVSEGRRRGCGRRGGAK